MVTGVQTCALPICVIDIDKRCFINSPINRANYLNDEASFKGVLARSFFDNDSKISFDFFKVLQFFACPFRVVDKISQTFF